MDAMNSSHRETELIILSSSDSESEEEWGNFEDVIPPPLPSSTSTDSGLGSPLPPSDSTPGDPVGPSQGPPPLDSQEGAVLLEQDIIKTLEETECSFCYAHLSPGDGILIRSCLHNFCLDCIQVLIQQSDASQILCPGSSEGTGCQGLLSDLEIKALISPEAYQNYLNRSLRTAENELEDLSRCQNPKCSGVFSVPKEAVSFKCLICEQVTCLKCKHLRDEDTCQCRNLKRNTSGASEQPEKLTKIDKEIKSDWDLHWAQISQSVSTSTQPSTSNGGSGDESLQNVLKNMEQSDLLRSTKEFTCSICYMEIPPGDGVILTECFHLFCEVCLGGTIEHCEETNVKCPFQMNDYSCQGYISEREIKAILSPESHDKFLRRSVNQAEMSMGNSFHCKTVNCTAWCEFEEGAEIFECPVCLKKNCLKCRGIHETISCLEYKAKLDEEEMDEKTKKMFAALIKKGTAMKCPTCKIMIQKTVGCDGMQCSVCKTHICWATKGPRWGPKGVGDRSGGCHCKEKGKRCHPKCGDCH